LRNQLIKTLVGVGDKQIIMMVSMNLTRLKKLNKRINGRHLDPTITNKRKTRALKNYKKEQTLVDLKQNQWKSMRKLIIRMKN
jgi:hypothetical protein